MLTCIRSILGRIRFLIFFFRKSDPDPIFFPRVDPDWVKVEPDPQPRFEEYRYILMFSFKAQLILSKAFLINSVVALILLSLLCKILRGFSHVSG